MKQVNVGNIRIALIVIAGLALLGTIISQSIIPLAFLLVVIGGYLGFELFLVFQIVYSISQWIAHVESEKTKERAKQIFEKEIKKPDPRVSPLEFIPPSGSKG